MWLLPHFAIPGFAIYRPPAASIFLILWIFITIIKPQTVRLRRFGKDWTYYWLALFFFYCFLSACYGYWNLQSLNKINLLLTYGTESYFQIVVERLLQISLVVLAFLAVTQSRHSLHSLMYWWLQGMAIVFFLHIFTYVFSLDGNIQRAGTFPEGNFGGMYYLLSFFIALEFNRLSSRGYLSYFFILSAFMGIFLTQSTIGIILVLVLFGIQYVLSSFNFNKLLIRLFLFFVLSTLLYALVDFTGFDFGIREKLFEESITAKSFSRIDRIESIRVGLVLFLDNPLMGQGLQTYGFLSNDLLTGTLHLMHEGHFRRIPNNIFVELLSEMGLVGFMLLMSFLASLIFVVVKRTDAACKYWLLGIAAVFLYWNAFPTYSVIFIWVFFGMILKSAQIRTSDFLGKIH
jgi:O-antigen ligase